MLVQQLKQLQDKLKKLKSQKIISKEDEEKIKKIEKWFEKFYEEDL
jgi:flavodoxin